MTDPIAALHSELARLAAEDAFSGVVRVTVGGAERFAGAYGFASRAWRIPNTLDTRFDTASITKLFTAVAALQRVDAGDFGLETGVVGYLDLRGTAISDAVTVRHLLTHSSGIGDDADEEAGERYEDLWRDRPNYAVRETADFLPQFVHRAPNFAPGAGCRYNNCGYVLLGLMIERATGKTYRDVVRDDVFRRAGMTESGFFAMDGVHERLAEGVEPGLDSGGAVTGWKRNIYSYPPIGSPDGGAHVTAGDLGRFLDSVRAGRLLSAARTADFLAPQVPWLAREGWSKQFGFGPWFRVDDDGTVVFLEKEGINVGASGFVRYYPGRDVTVAILSNLEEGAWEPGRLVHDLVMAGAFV